jgi:4-hydroxybenzoate polyprenyltransferase
MTAAYMALSITYSLWLKKRRWIDVLTLAALFVMRVLTGAVAAGVAVPGPLLGFVFAFVLALAVVKRLTALARGAGGAHLPGRGYAPPDLRVLRRLAYLAAGLAVCLFVVNALGASSVAAYDRPAVLALAVLPLALWLYRVIRLAAAGREDYDLVVFVTHDLRGLSLLALAALLVVLAV